MSNNKVFIKQMTLIHIALTSPQNFKISTDFTDLNLYWIKGALFVCFSFWLRLLD